MPRTMVKFVPEKNSNRGGLMPANPRYDHAYNAFLDTLDPRGDSAKSDAIRHELACSNDNRFRTFLSWLSHPKFKRSSLAVIARHCGISLKEFNEWAKKAYNQWSLGIAMQAGPVLTTDMVSDSRTKDAKCDRCDGFGWVYVEDGLPDKVVPSRRDKIRVRLLDEDGHPVLVDRQIRACPDCKGIGTVPKPGDTHARDKILEMAELAGGKRAPAVQINQNFGGMGMDAASERLSAITFDVDAEAEEVRDGDPGSGSGNGENTR